MPIKNLKIKDHGKCNEWERRRRDRLNDAFNNLAQLLPHYDPAKIPPKIDILDKSTEFVKELRLSNSRLLSSQAENDEKCKLIKELQDEVNKLILRVKQLTILLKKANITIPTGPEIKCLGSRRQKWSGKLKPEDVENAVIHSSESPTKAAIQPSQKHGLAKEGAQSAATTTTTPSTSVPVMTSLVSSNILGVNPNPVGSSQGPPIIIPLKETNSIKVPPTSTSALTTSSAVVSQVISSNPLILSSPQKTATLLTVSSSSSPTKLISSEPIFTTSSPPQLQLPFQTFILAPCPISGATTAYPTAPQSQFLTRIALPTPLLPRPLDGVSFQKIPIKSVLKPIPKIIRRRRKRTKKVQEPVLKLPTKVTNTGNDAATTEPISNPKESDQSRAVSTEAVEIRDISSPVPTNKIPEMEGGEIQEESPVEKASNSEKSESHATSSVDQVPREISTKVSSNPLVPHNETNTYKEVVDTQQTDSVRVTAMETSDNIPVLRIIETGAGSEESGIGLTNILCNVIVQNADKPKTTESVAVADHIIHIAKENFDKRRQIEHISNEAMEADSPTDIEATFGESVGITKEQLESSNVDVQAGTTKDISSQENFSQVVQPRAMPSTSIEVANEKTLGSEQSKQESKEIRNQVGIRSTEKLSVVTEKAPEHNPNVELEVRRASAEFAQLPVPSTTPSNFSVFKSRDDSNSVKPHEPELMKHVNNQAMTVTSVVRKEGQNSIIEPAPILASPNPEPLITPSSIPPPKSKEVPSTCNSYKGLPSLHQELMDTSDAVTTTDKISECIARSIDLIDANDSELMELGDHWEDTGGSPKSPISPTQMFLNMFPLLPRESTVSDHHSQHQPLTSHSIIATPTTSHRTSIAPFTVSSSSRSSFFIDAMLPEDHSTSNTGSIVDEIGIVSSSHVTPCLAMTPPQYASSSGQHISSPFSLSSNYYWTPATASCTIDNSFDYRPAPSIIPSQRTTNSTSSGGAPPTTTFMPTSSGTTKSFSTFSTVTTASVPNAFSTISSIAASNTAATASSTATTKSSSQVGKSGKSSKSNAASKQFSISDSSFHQLSTKTSKAVTTSTVATTSVTWSLSAPTQSVSSFSHNHSSSATSVQPQSSQNSAPITQVSFSHQHHGGATTTPSSTCSLLDSLNPMDASFFRPLINALDAHDFRTLDFASTTPLPPPLPPLIPPVPTAPLFTPQISSNPTSTSQPTISYHAPAVSSHDSHIPTLQSSLIHHHPSSSIFGSTTQQQSAIAANIPTSNIGSSKKHQAISSHAPPTQQISTPIQIPPPAPTSTKIRGNTTSSEKTPKTSGRQKSESSKPSRSGKSSRTQPYYIPNASSSQSGRQEEQNTSRTSHLPTTSQINTPFILSRNNPPNSISSSSLKSNESLPKTYGFQSQVPQHGTTNSGFHDVIPSNYSTPARQPPPPPVVVQQAQRQNSKSSSSEAKSQKVKEDKSKASSSSSLLSSTAKSSGKSTQQSHYQPTSTAPALQTTNHSAASLTQQPLRAPQASSAQPLPKPVTQISSKVMQSSEQIDNRANMNQPFHFHAEPFIFPDFHGGSSSRQFGNHGHVHHHSQYNQDVLHDEQEHISSSYSQRPHPYYLPEMSYESFNMPIQQHQPIQATHQPAHSHSSAVGNSRQSNSSSCNQNQSNAKYNYTPNVQITSSQFPIPTSESILPQPPQQLPHSTTHLQPSSSQSHQNHSIVHQENPPYNQQQHRSHVSEMQAAPQPLQNQVNISQPHRHTQEPPRQQQQQTQHRNQPPTSMAVSMSLPTSITSTSTSKSKQSQQSTLTQPFNSVAQQNQSNQPAHHLQQQHSQHQNQHQQPNVVTQNQQQQSSRSSSRTVNWMTDTAYRTTSSSSNTGNAKHRQGEGGHGPANNPFSVSKLVGSSSSGQPKNPQTEQQHQAPIQRPSNTARNKANTSSSNAAVLSNNTINSQNQSNYCAEALIRKNPPTGGDWNDFSFGPNPSFQGYSTHHPHHQPHQSNNQNPPNADNANYGQYHYPSSTSAHSSVTSHFTHFDYPQSQQFPTSHNTQHQQGGYHSSATQQHHIPPSQQHSTQTSQTHSSHHQPNQLQYPNHHHQSHHNHHHTHGSASTSSVSNFNLSTIFPEINDKRGGSASANNSNVGHGMGANSGISSNRSGGAQGQSSSCGYQHPGFGHQSGSGRNLHH